MERGTLWPCFRRGSYVRGISPALARWTSKGTVSERTHADYTYYAEKCLIAGKTGNVPLIRLSAEDLDVLYADLAERDMGPRGINHVHATARVALSRAVKKRLISHNPAREAEPPSYAAVYAQREYRTLSKAEVARFFEALAEDRYEALFVMAVLAGPRPAELRALRWEDLFLLDKPGEAGEARIRRTVSEISGQPLKVRNTTKTGNGRSVFLFPQVVGALRSHRARQNEERMARAGLWQDGGLVFPTLSGTVVRRANLTNRHFKPALERAGLPKTMRLYDLRHTFSTLWLDSGEDLKLLQEVLGHSRMETTANVYLHPSRQAHREAMRRFGEGFRLS